VGFGQGLQGVESHRRIGQAAGQKHSEDGCVREALREQLLGFEVFAAVQNIIE
jgi:hypothetical protein